MKGGKEGGKSHQRGARLQPHRQEQAGLGVNSGHVAPPLPGHIPLWAVPGPQSSQLDGTNTWPDSHSPTSVSRGDREQKTGALGPGLAPAAPPRFLKASDLFFPYITFPLRGLDESGFLHLIFIQSWPGGVKVHATKSNDFILHLLSAGPVLLALWLFWAPNTPYWYEASSDQVSHLASGISVRSHGWSPQEMAAGHCQANASTWAEQQVCVCVCVKYGCSEGYQREVDGGQRRISSWRCVLSRGDGFTGCLEGFFDDVSPPRKSGTREGEVSGRLVHLLHANLLLLRQTRAMFPSVCTLIMGDYRLQRGSQVIFISLSGKRCMCVRGGLYVGGYMCGGVGGVCIIATLQTLLCTGAVAAL